MNILKHALLCVFAYATIFPTWGWAAAPCTVDDFAAKVCVADEPQKIEPSEVAGLKCHAVSTVPNFEAQVRAAFTLAPEWMQSRLCKLKGMGIYPVATGTTLSWSYPSENFIGVNRAFIEAGEGFEQLQSVMRKHALSKKTLSDTYPANFGFSYSSKNPKAVLGLLYTMTHEMGHMIYNGPASEDGPKNFGKCYYIFGSRTCTKLQPGQWGSFTWLNADGPPAIAFGQPLDEYKDLVSFVQPANKSTVSSVDIDDFFRKFFKAPFATAFALYSPEEDFCETLASQVLAGAADTWTFTFIDGSTFDFRASTLNPVNVVMQQKLEWVRQRVTEKK